jgi:hypothetical protein
MQIGLNSKKGWPEAHLHNQIRVELHVLLRDGSRVVLVGGVVKCDQLAMAAPRR